MKKILFATTALALSAGMAAAEVKITGAANVGVASNDGAATEIYNNVTISASGSGTTDAGLEYGFSGWGLRGGKSYSFSTDARDGFNAHPGTASMPEVYVSGAFGKLAVKENGYNFYYNDDRNDDADVKYSLSAGGLTFGLVADMGDGDFSMSADANLAGVAANLVYDSVGGNSAVTLSYPIGAVTASVGIDPNDAESIKVAYSADGVSASFKYATDETWKVTAGMKSGAVAFDVETTDASVWVASGSYDLGGGASVKGGMNSRDDLYVGMSFSF